MKSIWKCFVGLALALTFAMANADLTTDAVSAAGFNKLSDKDKAEVISTITAKLPAANVAAAVPEPEKVEKWVGIGQTIAKTLGATAKELNIAVNDFSTTPVGVLTTALIVWHFIGGPLIHVFGGVLILLFGSGVLMMLQRRAVKVTIVTKPDPDHPEKMITTKTIPPLSERGDVSGWVVAYFIVGIASIIVIFTY